MSTKTRNSYENLILLCPTHHTAVDSESGAVRWTAEALRRMKREHEEWIASCRAVGIPLQVNVSQFHYLNIPRLAGLAVLAGLEVDLSFSDAVNSLMDCSFETLGILLAYEQVLAHIGLKATPLDPVRMLDLSSVGRMVTVDAEFRTKNLPRMESVRIGKWCAVGKLEKDPHVYLKNERVRFVLSIDPKWILGTTSWGEFTPSGGRSKLAGVAMVKRIDMAARLIVGTPLFIGIPRSPHDEWSRNRGAA
jgi:hypothetical protein